MGGLLPSGRVARDGAESAGSWDVTKLKGPSTWSWYHRYVILNVFNRHVVGWMVWPSKSARLAERIIAACCASEHIGPHQLTMHAECGSSMVSQPVAYLRMTKAHSRHSASNDNPFSRENCKTHKYR